LVSFKLKSTLYPTGLSEVTWQLGQDYGDPCRGVTTDFQLEGSQATQWYS
jgi:hypothetical protein